MPQTIEARSMRSQQALVRLEQSQEPIEEQLTEACHILRLDPGSLGSAGNVENVILSTQQTTTFLGREQWVLRWLLGRFQAKGSVGASARSEPKAWRLLGLLIHRIPLTNVARHLNTHKYLEILHETLQEALEIENSIDALERGHGSSSAKSPTRSGNENTREASESSNTLMGSPGVSPTRPSRKRKRSEISIIANQRPGLLERMTAVFCVLHKLLSQTKGKPIWRHIEQDIHESEYVKSVLRCHPTTAAQILGLSFELIYALLKAYESNPMHAGDRGDISVITNIMDDSLDLWNYRSGIIDDAEGNGSNESFASHCLVPALLLLETFDTISAPGVNLSRLVALLEHEVALHILIPACSSFSKSGIIFQSSDATLSSNRDPQLLTRYLAALRSCLLDASSVQQPSSTSHSERTIMLLNSLPCVFVHAARYSRWKGPKGRNNGLSWLEAVFRDLAEIAGIWTASQPNPSLNKNQLSVLERLLQVAIDHNISLGTTFLRAVAVNFCELFTEDNSQDRWLLTEQIFKLDANVFLIPSHDENLPQNMRALQNPLLEALFAKITALACQSGHETSELQQRIHRRLFLPLMQELASARALSSFIRYWHRSLSDLEEKRLKGPSEEPSPGLEEITILEVQSNSESLKRCFENFLTLKQIAGELDWLRSLIESFSKSSPVQEEARAFSALVILEAVVMSLSRNDNISSLREQGLSLIGLMIQQVRAGAWPKRHRWRLWKTLTQMKILWLHHGSYKQTERSNSEEDSNIQYALGRAYKSIEKGGNIKARSRTKKSVYREAYEAFGWILSFVDTYKNKHSDVEDAFIELKQALVSLSRLLNAGLEDLANSSEQSMDPESNMSRKPRWNGRSEGLKSQGTLAIALGARLILQYPSALSLCSSNLRRDLFRSLYFSALSLGCCFRTDGKLSDISFVDLWECLLESEYILNHAELKDDLVGMLVESQSPAGSHDNGRSGALSNELAIPSFLRLPLAILKRRERERILDLLLEACLQSDKRLTSNQLSNAMSLMVKLMRLPNATAELATNPSALWDLAANCQSYGHLDKAALLSFETLVSLTLSHTISTISQDRSSHYLTKSFEYLCSNLSGPDTLPDRLLTLGLVKQLLILFWSIQNSPKFDQNIDVSLWRTRFLENLASDLKILYRNWIKSNSPSFDVRSEAILDAIAEVPGLDELVGTDSVNSIVDILRKFVHTREQSQRPGVSGAEDLFRISVAGFKVIGRLEKWDKKLLLHSIIPLFSKDLPPHDRAVARSIVRSWISSLQEEQQLALLQELAEGQHEVEPSLLCLRIAIATVKDQSSSVKEALVQVYRSLCHKLKNSDGIRYFRLTMDCLESIILTKIWALSQWEIDTTLACIVFMASSHAPKLPTPYAGYIYSRLCGLMNGLLTVHRLKLRGRFHIIIPVLQSLLRCLFIPNASTHSRSSKLNPSPTWLPATKGLEAPQATAYARLLTSLCDPTVSSVTAPGKARQKEDLTPATDKARKMAGQHLPYVLMEYIQCRLHSNLASTDVKQALLPGVYAILDSMSQETRRMVNAAMDSSGRAMFRVLWADYNRFREWNEA